MTKNLKKSTKAIESKMILGGYMEAMEKCKNALKGKDCSLLFTPNAEIICNALNSKSLLKILINADILLPDGIGMNLSMKRNGLCPKERTNGIDFAEILLRYAASKGKKIFLLGAKEGYAKKAAVNLRKRYGKLEICGFNHGYFNKSGKDNDAIIERINNSKADIIFVCLGSPMQEIWLYKNRKRLRNVKLGLCLGGSIDVWSDNAKRAPLIMRKLGCEWLYRIISDPKRIRRILSASKILFL